MRPTKPSYASHQFPPEVISHAVWLYFRFLLGLRMAEEMPPPDPVHHVWMAPGSQG